MNADVALGFVNQMLFTAALIAAPILLVCLVVGIVISIIQVVTQIQEMTLTFVPKVICVGLTVLVAGGWMLRLLVSFCVQMFEQAASLHQGLP